MTGWDEAQKSITNSNVCGDLEMWYEPRTLLLEFGLVCEHVCVGVLAYVWRGIFMGACACEYQTDRWTDRNSQKMKVRYVGMQTGWEKIEERRFWGVNEKASETDKLFIGGFTGTITSWSWYFNILSVPCCVCVKINYLSSNKWFCLFLPVCVVFSLFYYTHHYPMPKNVSLPKIIHHMLPISFWSRTHNTISAILLH